MTDWVLILTMLGGETAVLNVPKARCLEVPAALQAGAALTLKNPQGRPYEVRSAVCVPASRKVPLS